jgi:hypothetical protein
MKELINLKGAKTLNKNEQKIISGGRAPVCNAPEVACYDPVTHRWWCALPQYCDC